MPLQRRATKRGLLAECFGLRSGRSLRSPRPAFLLARRRGSAAGFRRGPSGSVFFPGVFGPLILLLNRDRVTATIGSHISFYIQNVPSLLHCLRGSTFPARRSFRGRLQSGHQGISQRGARKLWRRVTTIAGRGTSPRCKANGTSLTRRL